jgi:hypothetical protein
LPSDMGELLAQLVTICPKPTRGTQRSFDLECRINIPNRDKQQR